MSTSKTILTTKQLIFKEMFIGTLIFVLVLGFFADYTNIVWAKSFSYIFMAAFVLQVLTSVVMLLKKKIVAGLKSKDGKQYRALMFFCVWFLLFVSKFIFIVILDLLFGDYVYVHGFIGILIVVASATILVTLVDYTFSKLSTKH
ncbi:hypothetical protein HY004_02380 [Candidatus Saccharibacteria bacterium]|nr:hypothetical protein [Candidatus Saccharibacteria bacterium]